MLIDKGNNTESRAKGCYNAYQCRSLEKLEKTDYWRNSSSIIQQKQQFSLVEGLLRIGVFDLFLRNLFGTGWNLLKGGNMVDAAVGGVLVLLVVFIFLLPRPKARVKINLKDIIEHGRGLK